jgi:hypothetical protein
MDSFVEYSANNAWIQHFDTTNGNLSNNNKYDNTYHVRPVSAQHGRDVNVLK